MPPFAPTVMPTQFNSASAGSVKDVTPSTYTVVVGPGNASATTAPAAFLQTQLAGSEISFVPAAPVQLAVTGTSADDEISMVLPPSMVLAI